MVADTRAVLGRGMTSFWFNMAKCQHTAHSHLPLRCALSMLAPCLAARAPLSSSSGARA